MQTSLAVKRLHARLPYSAGITSSRILDESTSTTTVENLRFSMQTVLEQTSDKDHACPYRDFSFGIVTNDFHVYRALAIARKQGIEHASESQHIQRPGICQTMFFVSAWAL